MSVQNFKRTVWSRFIQTELGKLTVFEEFSNKDYEGEAKKGARVKVLGIARPTIKTYIPNQDIVIEELEDNSQFIDIDQYKYFAFPVDDVDKAQTQKGMLEKCTNQANIGLAEDTDTYISGLVKDATVVTKSTAITTKELAIDAIDSAYEKLWDAGVKTTEPTEIIVAPWFYNLFKGFIIDKNTNNPQIIKTGVVGYYNNGQVRISNNLAKDSAYNCMCVRTQGAIAYASQLVEVEAVRPSKSFGDLVKGLHVYGAKVVRPKEAICLKLKKS